MVALAFAALYPNKLEKMCVLGASSPSLSHLRVGVRGIQRRMIEFACECGRPEDGLNLARQLAMTTYRSAEEFSGQV